MDLLDIERADGLRLRVSLRRFVREHRYSTPEHVRQEFDILRLVEAAAIPAPRPLLLDAEGQFFGVPALVLSYLPGKPLFPVRGIATWVDGLACGLVFVHAVTPDRYDLSGLHVQLADGMRSQLERRRDAALADPLGREVYSLLDTKLDEIDFSRPSLVHDDYWPGNTIWYRGRLTGIIDWTAAEVGDRRADVAQCRVDLTFSHGIEAADAFRDAYERVAGQQPDLWYFDLFRGLGALLYYEQWLTGYHDIGMRHLTQEAVVERLRAFLRRALRDHDILARW